MLHGKVNTIKLYNKQGYIAFQFLCDGILYKYEMDELEFENFELSNKKLDNILFLKGIKIVPNLFSSRTYKIDYRGFFNANGIKLDSDLIFSCGNVEESSF